MHNSLFTWWTESRINSPESPAVTGVSDFDFLGLSDRVDCEKVATPVTKDLSLLSVLRQTGASLGVCE